MKKHNLFKVVTITILLFVVLSWIIPTASYDMTSGFASGDLSQVGLYELLSYFSTSIQYFGFIALFIVTVGGFYAVAELTGAYREVLDRLVSKVKGHENLFLATLMVLIAVVSSFAGITYGQFVIYPFIIAFVLLLGYNKLTALSVTVGSTLVGVIGTTFGETTIHFFNYFLSNDVTLSLKSQIWGKVFILVLGLAILIFNTLRYAKHTKNETDEVTASIVPKKVAGRKSVTAFTVLSLVTLVIITLGQMPWSVWGVELFDKMNTSVIKLEVGGFKIFSKLLGSIVPMGEWGLAEVAYVLFFATLILAFIYRVKFNDLLTSFMNGVKKYLEPAIIVLLIYMVLVITTYHGYQLNIVHFLLKGSEKLNIFTMSLSGFLAGLFNVDAMYSAYATLAYVANTVEGKPSVIAVIYQAMYGLSMLVAPTSILLFAGLSYTETSYGSWLKHIWKVVLELLVVLLVIFLIINNVA